MAIPIPQPSEVINLGDEGLEEGDNLTPYLDEFWGPDTEVIVPGGEYEYDGGIDITTSEDAWLRGDGLVECRAGVQPEQYFADDDAILRIENFKFEEDTYGVDNSAMGEQSEVQLVNWNIKGDDGDEDGGCRWNNEHAGVARMINCSVVGPFSDGVYATSFADDPDGGFGEIKIYGGLYKNNDVNNIRIGGHNALVMNATVITDDGNDMESSKGIRVRETGENQRIINCDISMYDVSGASSPIHIAEGNMAGPYDIEVIVEDTRIFNESTDAAIAWNGDESAGTVTANNLHLSGDSPNELEGSGPFTNIKRNGAAMSPTEQKQFVDPMNPGSGSSGGDGGTLPEWDHTTEIRSGDNGALTYTFTTTGEIDQTPAEGNDTITENSDGSWTASGETGNGFSDEYSYNGEMTSFTASQHPDNSNLAYTLFIDGSEVDPNNLPANQDDGTNGGGDNGGDNGGTSNCTYNGEQRDYWVYMGTATDLYIDWVNCNLTTDEFESQTEPGNGTASLIDPNQDDGSDDGGGQARDGASTLLLLAALGAAAKKLS